MTQIYITSFFKTKELPDYVERWSAAVYQPDGFNFPKAAWTDIRDDHGAWIRPRNFIGHANPRESYHEFLWNHYTNRITDAALWLGDLTGPAALHCWCPYDQAAQRQLRDWGSFICHTSVLGEFLTGLGATVWYDADRLEMTVLGQKGLNVTEQV